MSRWLHWTVLGLSLALGAGIGAAIAIARSSSSAPAAPVADTHTLTPTTLDRNLDPGSPLSATAPGFTLTDQFGKRVSLRSLRGKVVVVSFNDPECTTICPLTTTALLHAKKLLGPAASQVELVGIGANPEATQVKWVRDYSQAHGMLHKWRFLTGSLPELKRVWRAYGIEAAVVKGTIDHTPATYVIDPHGRESRLFLTQMAYSSVDQLGYEIAKSTAALLPGHPRLHGTQSLAQIGLIGPHKRVALPRAGGGTVRLGRSSGPKLVLFFDTWAAEVTNLSAGLEHLARYASIGGAGPGHPPVVAIDEAKVEPSPAALRRFLAGLPRPLAIGVATSSAHRGPARVTHTGQEPELPAGSSRFAEKSLHVAQRFARASAA